MTLTRKSLADTIDSYDAEIAALQDSKRETFGSYREQLAATMGKDEIKLEIEGVKAAIRRRQVTVKKGAAAVEEKDALADEIFTEITTGTKNAMRVARSAPVTQSATTAAATGEGDVAPVLLAGQIQQSTVQPTAAAEVTTPDANTHGQTGTAHHRGLAASEPANAEAVAKKVGQSEQEAAVELPVDTTSEPAPTVSLGNGALTGDGAPNPGLVANPIAEPDAPKPLPAEGDEPSVTEPAQQPAEAKSLEQEPSEPEGSGGMQDRCESIPPPNPETLAGELGGSPSTAATPATEPSEFTSSDPQRSVGPTREDGRAEGSVVPFKAAKAFRPHCLNTAVCAGIGRQHCHTCEREHLRGVGQIEASA